MQRYFINIADSLGSLAAIVWWSLKQIVAVSFICPMPIEKFIEVLKSLLHACTCMFVRWACI